jgi:hypothetical protein
MFWGEDSGGVIDGTSVVQDAVLKNWEIVGIPDTRVMKSWDNDPDEQDDTEGGISVRWGYRVSNSLNYTSIRQTYRAKD